jgi:hypothetical protein
MSKVDHQSASAWSISIPEKNEIPPYAGTSSVEPTGIEPVTSCLQSGSGASSHVVARRDVGSVQGIVERPGVVHGRRLTSAYRLLASERGS